MPIHTQKEMQSYIDDAYDDNINDGTKATYSWHCIKNYDISHNNFTEGIIRILNMQMSKLRKLKGSASCPKSHSR